MALSVTPHLMFTGAAEEAMTFYVSLIPGSAISQIDRYGPDQTGAEGTVKRAVFILGGREFTCIDSPPVHQFGFTPSISLTIECQSEAEVDDLGQRLAAGGAVLMPPADYGFSSRFAWVTDRFGVSWQLNKG